MAQQINLSSVIDQLVIHEAKRWVGYTEKGGNNVGQIVEMFQKAVDGKASREAWCMAFVQFCIIESLKIFEIAHPQVKGFMLNALYPSEHCATTYRNTDKRCRVDHPTVGSVVIWKNKNNDNGHCGIVVEVLADGTFKTIEGNTSDGSGIVREGDGVYVKNRTTKGYGDMELLGFIEPWLLKAAPQAPVAQP